MNSSVMADRELGSSQSYAEQNLQTGVGAAMIALAILFVTLRFYVRLRFNRAPLGWDDWLVLAALIATVAAGLLVLMASIVDPNSYWLTANTDPDYDYTPANILHLKLVYISSIFYFSIVCPAKLSILFLYNRIFSVSQSFNIQVLLLRAVVTLYYLVTTIASIFSCWPLQYGWINTLNQAPYCFNFNYFWLAAGVIEAVLDVCLIALPVGMVSRLQMNAKKRMGITGVFLLGAFGVCTGVVKVYEGYVPGSRSVNSNATVVWSAVHGGVGIICACLPVCWPVILRMTSLGLLARFRTFSTKHGSNISGSASVRRWWRDHKPVTANSWASSVTISLSQRSRNERSARRHAANNHVASGLRRTSDTEMPMLAPARLSPAVAADDGLVPPKTKKYAPQVRIWSDASSQARLDESCVRHGAHIDKSVQIVRRCEYPV